VLDLGCGLGNFRIDAARRGCPVIALDGSPTAIAQPRATAASERLPILAEQVDLSTYRIADTFDTIVAIGLLMFFPRQRAAEHEVDEHFIGWNIVASRLHRFDAPGATVKAFATVVAQRRQWERWPDAALGRMARQ